MKRLIIIMFLSLVMDSTAKSQDAKQLIDSAQFYRSTNYEKVIRFAGLAYQKAALAKQRTLLGKSAYLLGVGNYLSGNFDKALHWYFESEQAYNSVKDTTGLIKLYADMCIVYLNIKKIDQADEVIKRAIQYSKAVHDIDDLATSYNNQGLVYTDKGAIGEAIKIFQTGYYFYKKVNDKNGMAYSLDYLSSAEAGKGLFSDAVKHLTESRELRKGLGDKTAEAIAVNNMGELYLNQNKGAQAAPYFIEAIKECKVLKFSDLEKYAWSMLAKSYEQQGKFKEAYDAQNTFFKLSQKFQEEKRLKTIEELQAKYQTNKKQQQIKLLNGQNLVQQLEINKRNTTIMIIAASFLIALVIGYQFYSRYKLKQEAVLQAEVLKQQDIATKGIIEAEERERKRIAAELHDGIGQLFTTVKMNMEILIERHLVQQPDADALAQKTMAMVDESCSEVRSIAHQMMPNALIKNGLVSALRDFINKIPNDKLKISLETKGIESGLESTTETVLYRVIQESVNNAIRHAAATSLDILLLSDHKEITVAIEDNGRGFDMNDKTKFTGIGLKNMISRVEYLKGTVDISATPGKGTLVAIYIPLV